MNLRGQCHCGNLAYSLDWPDQADGVPRRACGCDFCRMQGAVWTSHPAAVLSILKPDPEAVIEYEFGTETAVFHLCARCGVIPFATCDIEDVTFAVVNVNTLNIDGVPFTDPQSTDFEGENQDQRLARRQRKWISNVNFINT